MSSIERSQDGDGRNIVEIMARVLLGQIKREDLDENNQAVLGYYSGLMDDDPKFRAQVSARKNQITLDSKNGRRIPLYTEGELAKAKRHGGRRSVSTERALQPDLFESPVQSGEPIEIGTILDPERKLARLHSELQNRFSWNSNRLIAEETLIRKNELKDLIGLPIQRGKDPHINDDYYKLLVKKIADRDVFGIFHEFDRVLTEVPPELDMKINQVKGLVGELLNPGLNLRERYRRLDEFTEEYWVTWGE